MYLALHVFLLLTSILLSLFALSLSLTFFFGPPFVFTPKKIIKQMLSFTSVKKNDTIIDLGSGDGRILLESVPYCKKAIGYEINFFLVAWSNILIKTKGLSEKAHVKCMNYNDASLREGTIVFLYNLPSRLPQLEKKLRKELRPGTKIVSYKFKLSAFTLARKTKSGIYLYIV
jgi:hypothetical protein